jgi:hypothetical protein
MNSIGRKARIRTAGACRPTAATTSVRTGGERVAGRGRGDADDHARDEAERALLQTLLLDDPSTLHRRRTYSTVLDRCPRMDYASVRSVGSLPV